jgi:hypothetical protein
MIEGLATLAVIFIFVMVAGPVLAQPQVSGVALGEVSHNHPDDVDLGVSYSLTGADAARTAVAWYRDSNPLMSLYMVFEGDASNALLDLSGSGQTVSAAGDVAAATAWDATGGHGGGGAYLYSATSGNLFFLDAGSVISTGAYTKAVWLKRVAVSGSAHNIMSSASAAAGYHVLYAGGSAGNKVTAFHSGQAVKVADPDTLVDGVWYHFAVTYQSSDGAMKLYRDGVEVATGTAPAFTDQTLFVGSFSPTAGNQWEGYLDDVRIYDHVLSPEQIMALYNGSDTARATELTAGEDWYAEVTPFSSTAMGSAVQSNTLTIATDPPIVGDIPDEQVLEDVAFSPINLDGYVTDANHADNLITWTASGNSSLSVGIASGIATISAPANWFGSETITFRATDPDGNYNEDAATFGATSVNDPPTVANPIPDVNASQDDPPIDNYVDLNTVFDDVEDAGNLSFAVLNNTNPSLVDVTIDVSDMVDLSFFAGQSGTATITISATDMGKAASVSDEFIVNVSAANTPPTVVGPILDVAVNEDNPDIDNYADLNTVFSDAEDGGDLNFQILSNTNPSLVTVTIGAADSAIDLSFGADLSGTAIITIRATDSQSEFVDDDFTVDVAAVNDAPVVLDIPDQTVTAGTPFATINLDSYVTDVDNTPAEMNWTSSGATDLTVMISGLNVATITAPGGWTGTETITFTATDPGPASGSDQADFTVIPDNPPTVVSNTLISSSGNDYTEDTLNLTYTLGGGATTSAIAWQKNGQPLMELFMPFEAGPTNALGDLSGNGNTVGTGTNATLSPAAAWSPTNGRNGTGTYTYGTGSNSFYLDAGHVFPTSSSYTKLCWVYKTSNGTSLNIMSGSLWGGGSGGHVLYASGSQGLKLTASHNGVAAMAQDTIPLELDTWYFVGVTFDYATGEMILYRDGQPVDTAIVTGPSLEVTDDVLLIGSLTDLPGNEWAGYIDNARLFNYVVSPAQIAEFYATEGQNIQPDETTVGDDWSAVVIPLSSTTVGTGLSSNTITIVAPCCVMRGDFNDDSSIDVADLTSLVAYMFKSGAAPSCLDHIDINNDDSVDINDLTLLVAYMFKEGAVPVPCD